MKRYIYIIIATIMVAFMAFMAGAQIASAETAVKENEGGYMAAIVEALKNEPTDSLAYWTHPIDGRLVYTRDNYWTFMWRNEEYYFNVLNIVSVEGTRAGNKALVSVWHKNSEIEMKWDLMEFWYF